MYRGELFTLFALQLSVVPKFLTFSDFLRSLIMSREQRLSGEDNTLSSVQEVSYVVWNAKTHYLLLAPGTEPYSERDESIPSPYFIFLSKYGNSPLPNSFRMVRPSTRSFVAFPNMLVFLR